MLELWVLPAVLSVVFFTAFRVYQKRLSSQFSSIRLSFLTHGYTAVLLAPVSGYFLFQSPDGFTPTVWLAIGISALANVLGLVLIYRAYELEDMSVVVPLVGVQPLGVALVEPVFIGGAQYAASLVVAALLAAVGLYTVLIEGDEYLTPLKRLKSSGPQFALASAFVYVGAVVADGYIVKQVTPFGYAGVLSGLTTMILVVILLLRDREMFSNPRVMLSRDLFQLGAIRSFALVSGLVTLSLTTATKFNIFLQLSPVLSVLAGGTLLREPHTIRRVGGAGLIVVGVVVALGSV